MNDEKDLKQIEAEIRAIDPHENRVETVEELIEEYAESDPDRAEISRKLAEARDQQKALKLALPGGGHAVICIEEDGTVYRGSKAGVSWHAFADEDVWTASKSIRATIAMSAQTGEPPRIVEPSDTRLFGAGTYLVSGTTRRTEVEGQ